MMLADPGRMHAEAVGVERLVGDVGHELVGAARIVFVVVVAQREVAEFHAVLPSVPFGTCSFLYTIKPNDMSSCPAKAGHPEPLFLIGILDCPLARAMTTGIR